MKHLNETTIQAFLDGELAEGAVATATQHLALCGRCANALLEAEAELAEVNLAFASEATSPVPSQRIWARIENEIDFLGASSCDAIKVETKSFWHQWATFLSPSQVAFAGGLAAVVLASFFALQVVRQTNPEPDVIVAVDVKPVASNPKSDDQVPIINQTPAINRTTSINTPSSSQRFDKASYQPRKVNKPEAQNPKSKIQNPKSLQVLPEEHDYINSIAQLSKAVETSDEFVMRPSFRVDYERNLAVMDGAISAMQKQVRSNPKDENAKRILFASYQNKIELLNTIAEKSQMVASLR